MNIAAERPEDEIQGPDAIAALDDALKLLSAEPKVRVTVRDIAIKKLGGKIFLTVKYGGRKSNEFTARLSRAWATVAYHRFGRVLGK